jgi:hypothetical protein
VAVIYGPKNAENWVFFIFYTNLNNPDSKKGFFTYKKDFLIIFVLKIHNGHSWLEFLGEKNTKILF